MMPHAHAALTAQTSTLAIFMTLVLTSERCQPFVGQKHDSPVLETVKKKCSCSRKTESGGQGMGKSQRALKHGFTLKVHRRTF